ncbi:hypothetical protein V3C99_016100, partial [Haemonchus contortus]|uniref:Fibrinogen C-terminal domain-containing protein n=1 Tax=Haemonchus contortus TaxID=6289 RepID=A0A7I4Z141_HAECO
ERESIVFQNANENIYRFDTSLQHSSCFSSMGNGHDGSIWNGRHGWYRSSNGRLRADGWIWTNGWLRADGRIWSDGWLWWWVVEKMSLCAVVPLQNAFFCADTAYYTTES